METLELSHGWWLQYDGKDLLISGPGSAEIVLNDFNPTRLEASQGLAPELLGTFRQQGSFYRLDPTPESLELQLISTWDSADPETPTTHYLHVGNHINWMLDDAVATQLHAWFEHQRTAHVL